MRRLITLLLAAVVAVATSLMFGAASGRADNCTQGGPGTQTCTMHGPQTLDLGPGCGTADAVLHATNSVFHITVNKAGDGWVTGTAEGQLVVYDDSASAVGTGHAQSWFGEEDNKQNGVEHFTTNGYANMLDGSRIGFHVEGQFTMNANGVITVNRTTFDCR